MKLQLKLIFLTFYLSPLQNQRAFSLAIFPYVKNELVNPPTSFDRPFQNGVFAAGDCLPYY